MREILFRGKRKDGSSTGWVFGYYAVIGDRHAIIKKELEFYLRTTDKCEVRSGSEIIEVLPQTVSQFTGFYDKNGIKIYDGDILRSVYDEDYPEYASYEYVQWIDNGWYIGEGTPDEDLRQDMLDRYSELAGNVWDNPELLEEENE